MGMWSLTIYIRLNGYVHFKARRTTIDIDEPYVLEDGEFGDIKTPQKSGPVHVFKKRSTSAARQATAKTGKIKQKMGWKGYILVESINNNHINTILAIPGPLGHLGKHQLIHFVLQVLKH